MKRFYCWIDQNFQLHQTIAYSKGEVRKQALLNQLIVIKIYSSQFMTKNLFSYQDLLMITKQLATMLQSGLPILESLEHIAYQHANKNWQFLINNLKYHLQKGESLSQVLKRYDYVFPHFYQEMIKTGELTGQLDNSFNQLAKQLDQSIKLKKRIKKAIRYPAFLLFLSLMMTLLILIVVIPKFAEVYQSFDRQLPLMTRAIILLSHFISGYWFMFILIIFFVFINYRIWIKKYFRRAIDNGVLKLPILGTILVTGYLSHIFQILSITEQSGIPLIKGLTATHTMINNDCYRQSIQSIMLSIQQGHGLSDSFSKHKCFPSLCAQLIHIGEESGSLEHMLMNLAQYYQQQNIELTDHLSQFIEPILMIIIGLIIGFLVIAIYLPIFELGDVIQ